MKINYLSFFEPTFTSTQFKPDNILPKGVRLEEKDEVMLPTLILTDTIFLIYLVAFASEPGFFGDYEGFDYECSVSYVVFAGLLILAASGCRNRNPHVILPLMLAKVFYFLLCTSMTGYQMYLALRGGFEGADQSWKKILLIAFPYIVYAWTTALFSNEIMEITVVPNRYFPELARTVDFSNPYNMAYFQ
ncbi:unnamed protein product [Caenorhabditis auriculariae]|uniref:Uncharacterized protein n=1 Tax=Caenorhabditis auriculariae TaxID=2777116 RepID=A0A8S1GVK9_9PELO|nr:unnamed protein product [Caenorhabditis auriculariae]